ncbi:DUF4391 domain-containing protein [Thermophilibacter provencensis]|uniref:DUF4391 domain-containing protein n=1 Tax=Thermophilibacter provencensis TaxID=1852386 RepID=UPI0023541AF0|nr:DUF4391 domain-containing protein [Thermophilibacter provencensis]
MLVSDVVAALGSRRDRSSWDRGVTRYALDMLADLDGDAELAARTVERTLLDGAPTWHDYSWGGCALIYDADGCACISVALTRRSQAEQGATVVDRIESTGAFDPGRSEYADFLGALAFGRLSQGDLWEYLVDLSRTVALSRAIGGLGFYPVCPARDREKLIALTSRYDEMGASVKRLKEQRRSKDITLNESAKLRMEMKEEERRLRAVADEIKEICNGRSR